MAQEGRDRNSFEAKGPSAENAQLDKSVATATESLQERALPPPLIFSSSSRSFFNHLDNV